NALFETGKALGSIKDVPMDQTFQEWTDAGNSFRGSLETGWLTADVLTTTLQGFTGEMTEAQLMAKGFTQTQAAQLIEMGRIGVEAATKVRTFTQLMQTTKESIASGWSASFRIMIGNFEEATELFTGISGAIGGFIQKSADARNALLQGWKDLGGRTALIDALKMAFQNLGNILKPIREAFREVFPAMTAQRLFDLTQGFANLVKTLTPSERVIENLKRIFKGFFSILSIGWTVLKEGVKFIGQIVAGIIGLGGGPLSDVIAGIADFFTDLQGVLVTGGGIASFFDKLMESIKAPLPFIIKFKDAVVGLFDGFDPSVPDAVGDSLGRFGDRFESVSSLLQGRVEELGTGFGNALEKIGDVLDKTWDAISNWFSMLGSKIAEVMGEGNFDQVLDAINTGLLAAIATAIALFIRRGFNFNFDVGSGLLDRIGQSFEQLTGVLTTMQQNLKANILLKIAAAIAILTASVLVLSLIDSEALTKALTAMAVGFGQLIASFAIISRLSAGPRSAASLSLLAVGMTLLAGAILILAQAAKTLSELNWDELARGLAGVTALLAIMTTAALILQNNTGGLIRAGIGMIGIAVALNLLAGAVKIFATMSWEELGRGFAAVAVGLGLIALAMRIMPSNMIVQALALIGIATALTMLAGAIALFGTMEWDTMGKGFAAIATGLLIIALAMNLMPGPSMILTAAGLVLVGIALNEIAAAMLIMGNMSWGEIARGLAAMAGALIILAAATYAMSGAIPGAIAIGIVSASLLILARVVEEFSNISWGDLLRGLGGIAAVFLVLGVAAALLQPVIPAMLGLGIALALIGAGFALFGAGAMMVAKAFEFLARAGARGSAALVEALKSIGKAIPALATGLAEGIIEFIKVIGEAAPTIIDAIGNLLAKLLDKIIQLVPKIGEALAAFIDLGLKLIREKVPLIIQTGLIILTSLLLGIRNNMYIITNLGIDIILAFIQGVTDRIDDIISAGLEFLLAFIEGIAENIIMIADTAADIITEFIDAIVGLYLDILTAGTDALIEFLKGITNNLSKIADTATKVIVEFCKQLGNNAFRITNAATTLIIVFATAIANSAFRIVNAATNLITRFITQIGASAGRIATAATNMIITFITTIGNNASRIVTAGVNTVIRFIQGLGQNAVRLANAAAQILVDFLNGLADAINRYAPQIRAAGARILGAIFDGLTGGIASKAGEFASKLLDKVRNAVGTVASWLGIGSPSKLFYEFGE
ncbi:MAG: hypothetical protein ABWY25_01895, partial [Paenisporosarcina sp.]